MHSSVLSKGGTTHRIISEPLFSCGQLGVDNNWSIQKRCCCYNFNICSPSCIVSHSTLRDVLGHISMARIALKVLRMTWILQYSTTLFLTAMWVFSVPVISLERARNKQFPSPRTWSIVRGSPIVLDILGVKRPLRTDNLSLCAAWFRQLESVGGESECERCWCCCYNVVIF